MCQNWSVLAATGWCDTNRSPLCVCRATALHENLAARLKLLAELHWAQPRPLSAAEARLRDRELPALQAAAAQLQQDLTVRL